MRVEGALDEGSPSSTEATEGETRVYELGFHLDPDLPTEEVKKAFADMRALIEEKGSIVAQGEPMQIPLAYTISRSETGGRRDFNSAHLAWIAYETSSANHGEVTAAANADKRIIRFIDIVTTKDAARHAEALREVTMAPSVESEEAPPADAELDEALEKATL